MEKFIYNFAEGKTEMKALLGGKGANLAEMNRIGLPVPPGFTITTEACIRYLEMEQRLDEKLKESIFEYLKEIEKKNGKKFGDVNDPLLLSVRSGAVTSMPGMMDTILNLGLNDKSVKGLAKKASNPRFAYDSYRRLIQMFANVVLDIPGYEFDNLLEKKKEKNDYTNDTELSVDDLKDIIEEYKRLIKKRAKIEFPQKPEKQLLM
ncbi:MAG: pyruvate, phosphate dikinase, partial [Halanaerobium sp. MSAO_Bac5]